MSYVICIFSKLNFNMQVYIYIRYSKLNEFLKMFFEDEED